LALDLDFFRNVNRQPLISVTISIITTITIIMIIIIMKPLTASGVK